MVHVYYGDGKGKTTAAVGLAVRCAGRGQKVVFVQFLKSSNSGERNILAQLPNITLTHCPEKQPFTFEMTELQRAVTARDTRALFDSATALALTERYNLIVLDEIFSAVNEKMLPESELYSFLEDAPETLEIVLTGHNPSERILELADYISEIKNIKHPYEKGVPARLGIEM